MKIDLIASAIAASGMFAGKATEADALRQVGVPLDGDTPVECRAVARFEGLYAVSKDGRVWSFQKRRWLVAHVRGRYPSVCLCAPFLPRNQASYAVHLLVANAWVPRVDGKPLVNHIDGNKLNAQAANLEWVTSSENALHAFATGLRRNGTPRQLEALSKVSHKAHAATRRLTPEEVSFAKVAISHGVTQRTLGWFFGMHQSAISRVINQGYRSVQ